MLEWTNAFAILLAAHLLGDFYLQPKRMAEEKGVSLGMFLAHCAIYAACMAPCCWFLFEGWCQALLAWGIVSISHLVIDAAKRRLLNRPEYIKPRVELCVFVTDQMAHVAICVLDAMAFVSNPVIIGVLQSNLLANGGVSVAGVVALVLSLLTIGRPAAILIRMFLSSVDASPGVSKYVNDACVVEGQQEKASVAMVRKEEPDYIRAGKWIGILERTIVVVMTFWGEYGAIAFVFTAKSIARFKMLDDRYFAERYLVGTLASVALAILATLLAKGMLAV